MLTCCIFLFINIACAQVTATDIKKLNWLEGNWKRTGMKEGRSGNEHWTKLSDTEWQGIGVNMKGQDTAFVEKIKIIQKGEHIYYVADVPENKEPVLFKFISITEDSFVCENPKHDFPKKISYRKDGNMLKAIISGNGKSIAYSFEKQ